MKNLKSAILVLAVMLGTLGSAFAQEQQDTVILKKIVKQNGASFTGRILSEDAREILMDSQEVGLVYIPRHEVREISVVSNEERTLLGGLFSTRYFLTTNGFPIAKGDNYVQWNLFGPDFQFGVADNFGVGIMTSWVGMPIIGTAKYSVKLGKNLHGGLGFLGGTGSWAYPEFGLLLPFGFLTAGTRMTNINVSAGYGALFSERTETTYTLVNEPTEYSTNNFLTNSNTVNDAEGRVLLSLAGTFRLNRKFSFVFDSFIMLPGKTTTQQVIKQTDWDGVKKTTYSIDYEEVKRNPLIVLAPGLRFQANEHSSIQFGFTGVHYDGEFLPVPVPMLQWFRKI